MQHCQQCKRTADRLTACSMEGCPVLQDLASARTTPLPDKVIRESNPALNPMAAWPFPRKEPRSG